MKQIATLYLLSASLFLVSCDMDVSNSMQQIDKQDKHEKEVQINISKPKAHELCLNKNIKFTRLSIFNQTTHYSNLANIIRLSDNVSSFIPYLKEQGIELQDIFQEFVLDAKLLSQTDIAYTHLFPRYKNKSSHEFSLAIRELPPPTPHLFVWATKLGFPSIHIDKILDKAVGFNLNQDFSNFNEPGLGMQMSGNINLMSIAISSANLDMIHYWERKNVELIDSSEIPIFRLVHFAAKSNPPERIIELIKYLQAKGFQPDHISAFMLVQRHPAIAQAIKDNFNYSDKTSAADLELIAAFKHISEHYRLVEFEPDPTCAGKTSLLTDKALRHMLEQTNSVSNLSLSALNIERLRLLEPEKMQIKAPTHEEYNFFNALLFPESGNSLDYLLANKEKMHLLDEFNRDLRYYAIKFNQLNLLQYLSTLEMPEYPDKTGPNFRELADLYHPNDMKLLSVVKLLEDGIKKGNEQKQAE